MNNDEKSFSAEEKWQQLYKKFKTAVFRLKHTEREHENIQTWSYYFTSQSTTCFLQQHQYDFLESYIYFSVHINGCSKCKKKELCFFFPDSFYITESSEIFLPFLGKKNKTFTFCKWLRKEQRPQKSGAENTHQKVQQKHNSLCKKKKK